MVAMFIGRSWDLIPGSLHPNPYIFNLYTFFISEKDLVSVPSSLFLTPLSSKKIPLLSFGDQ